MRPDGEDELEETHPAKRGGVFGVTEKADELPGSACLHRDTVTFSVQPCFPGSRHWQDKEIYISARHSRA